MVIMHRHATLVMSAPHNRSLVHSQYQSVRKMLHHNRQRWVDRLLQDLLQTVYHHNISLPMLDIIQRAHPHHQRRYRIPQIRPVSIQIDLKLWLGSIILRLHQSQLQTIRIVSKFRDDRLLDRNNNSSSSRRHSHQSQSPEDHRISRSLLALQGPHLPPEVLLQVLVGATNGSQASKESYNKPTTFQMAQIEMVKVPAFAAEVGASTILIPTLRQIQNCQRLQYRRGRSSSSREQICLLIGMVGLLYLSSTLLMMDRAMIAMDGGVHHVMLGLSEKIRVMPERIYAGALVMAAAPTTTP